MKVGNLILEKKLGESSFSEVYLTTIEGDNDLYATKKYDREEIEKVPDLERYMRSEIIILNELSHPNIIKLRDAKKTKKHFYLVMEYCNGGNLKIALEKYQKKFENEEDKENLNMLKAEVKIIDFGFACKFNDKNVLKDSVLGDPMNMSYLIREKLNNNGRIKRLRYDIKDDIWSLGSICYEMLIGKSILDSEDMDELVEKIEKGLYNVPTNLSKEVISFINCMLQYDPESRLTCDQLINHQFLTTDVNYLHKIALNKVSNKIIPKKNNTIWSIFNEVDENKLIQIGQLPVIPEEKSNVPVQNNNSFNPPLTKEMKDNSFPDKDQIKGFNTTNNSQFQNTNNINFNNNSSKFNNDQNFGVFLPFRGRKSNLYL